MTAWAWQMAFRPVSYGPDWSIPQRLRRRKSTSSGHSCNTVDKTRLHSLESSTYLRSRRVLVPFELCSAVGLPSLEIPQKGSLRYLEWLRVEIAVFIFSEHNSPKGGSTFFGRRFVAEAFGFNEGPDFRCSLGKFALFPYFFAPLALDRAAPDPIFVKLHRAGQLGKTPYPRGAKLANRSGHYLDAPS